MNVPGAAGDGPVTCAGCAAPAMQVARAIAGARADRR